MMKMSANDRRLVAIIISAVLFIVGYCLAQELTTARLVIFSVALLCVGAEVFIRAGRNILHGQIFDENFLMSIAYYLRTLSSVIAQEAHRGNALLPDRCVLPEPGSQPLAPLDLRANGYSPRLREHQPRWPIKKRFILMKFMLAILSSSSQASGRHWMQW